MENVKEIQEHKDRQGPTHPLIAMLQIGLELEEAKRYKDAVKVFTKISEHKMTPSIKGLKDTVDKAIARLSGEVPSEAPAVKEEKLEINPQSIDEKNLLCMMEVSKLQVIPEIRDAMPISQEDYDTLVESIKKRGVQVPLVVTPTGHIVCGYNRFSVALELGMKRVPVIIKDIPNAILYDYAVRDNLERRQLTPDQKIAILSELASRVEATKGRPKINDERVQAKDVASATGESVGNIYKARMYEKKVQEDPDLKGKPVSEVLYGKPKEKRKAKISFKMGRDDSNMDEKILAEIQALIDMPTEVGDTITITMVATVKAGKKK